MAFRRGLVSISVFEAPHLDAVDRELRQILRPDGLYPVPYPLHYGTTIEPNGDSKRCVLPNFASSVARKFSVRLEDHAFDSGWATTTVRLTPSLADGDIRHLARHVYRTGCIENEVAVGLSRARWAQDTLLDRRAALVSAITRSVKLVAGREGWRPDIPEAVQTKFVAEQRELAGFNEDSKSHIKISRRVFDLLHLSVWNRLSAQEQQGIIATVTEALAATSRNMRFVGIGSFGAPSNELPVAMWRDEETGLPFSLIPGGEFCPGYNAQLLREYEKLYERFYSMTLREAQEAGEVESVRCRPDSLRPFGSMGTCDIRAKGRSAGYCRRKVSSSLNNHRSLVCRFLGSGGIGAWPSVKMIAPS